MLYLEDEITGKKQACARATTYGPVGKDGREQLGDPVVLKLPHCEPKYMDDFFRSFAEYKACKGFVIVEGDHPRPSAPDSPSSSDEADSAKKDVDIVTVAKYFRLPISAAARRLGVGETWLKQKCRQHNICRWPYRKVRSIEKVVEKLEAQLRDPSAGNTANRITAIEGQISDLLKARDRICTGQVDEGSDDFDAIQATVAAGFGQFDQADEEEANRSATMRRTYQDHETMEDTVDNDATDGEKPSLDELLTIPCHIEVGTPPSVRGFPLPDKLAPTADAPQMQQWNQQISLLSWSFPPKTTSVVPTNNPTKATCAFPSTDPPQLRTPPRTPPVNLPLSPTSCMASGCVTPPRSSTPAPPNLRHHNKNKIDSPMLVPDLFVRSPFMPRLNLEFSSPFGKGGISPLSTPTRLRGENACCDLFGAGQDSLGAFHEDDFSYLLAIEPPIPQGSRGCQRTLDLC